MRQPEGMRALSEQLLPPIWSTFYLELNRSQDFLGEFSARNAIPFSCLGSSLFVSFLRNASTCCTLMGVYIVCVCACMKAAAVSSEAAV